MTIMKKALCLILAICMLSIPVSFAEDTSAAASEASEVDSVSEFSDVDYETPLGISINTLVEKNIISGFPDGTYKADQTLTRAEFAKIIVCFLGNYTETVQDSGFPDVDNVGGSAHWAKSYIKIAKDMNIISGFPDGTFMPDAPVTYEQAVKMIMCALGFTNLSYPDGYIQLAMQKKLFANSTHTSGQSGAITRGTTAIFIYNALSITPNNKTTDSTNAKFTGISLGGGGSSGGGGGGGGGGGRDDDSRKITGIVWGTETTMLDSTKSILYSDEIALVYQNKEGETVREDLPVASKYLKKVNDYLGKHIRATIKEDDDGKEYISDITIVEKNNRAVTVDIEDFISYTISDETGEPTVTYYNSDGKKDSLVLSNPENVYIIYNDKSICMSDAADYEFDPSFITDTKIGSFKFISNDGDKKFDIVFVESYKTAVINGKQSALGVVKLKYGEDDINVLYSDPDKKIDRTVSTMKNSSSNSAVDIKDLDEYDVIDYKESIDKDLFTAEITVAEDTAVSGSFIKMEDDKIQIRNKSTDKKVEYKLNYNYLDYLENYSESDKYIPEEYDNVKLYFNADKKVAAIEEIISTADSKYGYITMLAYKDADGTADEPYIGADETPDEGDKVAIMLYQVDPSKSTMGSHTTSPLLVASSVRVDGVMIKNNPEEVMTRLLTAADLINEGKPSPNNKNSAHSSFIRYEMSGGQVTALDTVLDATGTALSTESDERFNTLFRSTSLVYDETAENGGKHKYYSSSSAPGFYKASGSYTSRTKLYNNSNKSTLIFVPGNRADSKYYSASKFIYSNFYNTLDYYVEAYNVSGSYAEFLIQYISDGKDIVTSFSTMAVITSLDDEDNIDPDILKIKYRTAASSSELSIELHSDSPAFDKYEELNVGDVILFSTALDKTMYDFYHALDVTDLPDKRIDNETLLRASSEDSYRRINGFDIYPEGQKNFAANAEYRTIYGTVQSYDNSGYGTIVVNPMLYTDYFEELDESFDEEYNLETSTKLFVYDETEEKVTMYSSNTTVKNHLKTDLFTKEKFGYKDADKIFVYTTNSSAAISSGEATVKFIYLIRTAAQANPGNYEGVDTPEEDPLAEVKLEAKNELTDYIDDLDMSDYTIHGDAFAGILSDGKHAINDASTEEEITVALDEAKANVDNVPSDSYIDYAKAAIEDYVDSNIYTDAAEIIENVFEDIDAATTKSEIDTLVANALSDIDETVITLVVSDKLTAFDEFIENFGYDFTEDTELNELIDGYKESFINASSVIELNEAYDEATAAIEEFVTSNYPKEDTEDPEAEDSNEEVPGGDINEEDSDDESVETTGE